MFTVFGIALIAYCVLIWMMGTILGDFTKTDDDLLDDLNKRC